MQAILHTHILESNRAWALCNIGHRGSDGPWPRDTLLLTAESNHALHRWQRPVSRHRLESLFLEFHRWHEKLDEDLSLHDRQRPWLSVTRFPAFCRRWCAWALLDIATWPSRGTWPWTGVSQHLLGFVLSRLPRQSGLYLLSDTMMSGRMFIVCFLVAQLFSS